MLRITHTRGRSAPRIEELDLAVVRIGSAASNEVSLRDPNIAAAHAEVRVEDGVASIAAVGSDDLFVNGARVKQSRLGPNDRVVVGHSPGAELLVEVVASASAGAPASAPADDGRVDLETAERLVRDAVVRATMASVPDAHRLVTERVSIAHKRVRRANAFITLGIGLALVAAVFVGGLLWRAHEQAEALSDEAGFDSSARPVSGDIPTQVLTARQIYDQNRTSLYVIGFLEGNKIGGVCTAFAIDHHRLATNAHCVNAIRGKGGQLVVTQNDSGGKVRFKIAGMQGHPSYNPKSPTTDTPDVGLLRVDAKLPTHVTIANDAELRAIGPGDDVYVLGFPGRVMDPVSPSATFLSGHVGRVMSFDQSATTPDRAVLIQHDAVTRGGNSGSPVFNQYGHVIAIHAAHIDEEAEQTHDGQKTTVTQSSPFRIGMRIDLLKGVPQP